jgi:hypothetical protein
MSFKHELGQVVTVTISEEEGHIKARAEYTHGPNQYLIHYRAADGRAVTRMVKISGHRLRAAKVSSLSKLIKKG